MIAILHGVQVPPLGGDTIWCDAVAAYAGLDAATKARIEHLKAEHDTRDAQARYAKSPEELERIRQQNPPREHPIVRIHPETGERILYVNAAVTKRIVGVPPEESEQLLNRLFEQFKRPEYHVRIEWTCDPARTDSLVQRVMEEVAGVRDRRRTDRRGRRQRRVVEADDARSGDVFHRRP